jgi:hypothetical protein
MTCKTREDPEIFILRLEEARISLDDVQKDDSEKITEGQFLLHLLHSLPEEYESTVAQLLYEMKKDEEDSTSKIDLEAIMDALSEKFEKTKEKRSRNKNDEDEAALIRQSTKSGTQLQQRRTAKTYKHPMQFMWPIGPQELEL